MTASTPMSSRQRIVTCFPITVSQLEQIRNVAGDDFEVISCDQEEIHQAIFSADIFCGHAKDMLNWEEVVGQGRLKWIQSTAAGLDHCLVEVVVQSSVLVSGCSGLFAPQVAEQTMALLCGLIRSLPVFFRAQQIQEYIRRPTDNLFNKHIGILGFGGNGRQIAKVLRPMVAKLSATDFFPDDCHSFLIQGILDEMHSPQGLDSLLSQIDILIVTLPLTKHNENLIGARELSKMKAGSYLINVGRGSVVNTEALIEHLLTGHLAAAGLDVVDPEPLPADSPLWNLKNVILTPHVGAQSPLRVPKTVDLFCENLNLFRQGKPLVNQVDKGLGFPVPEFRVNWK
jgi:phosphoglycerate dehydrogenase-like enzyme